MFPPQRDALGGGGRPPHLLRVLDLRRRGACLLCRGAAVARAPLRLSPPAPDRPAHRSSRRCCSRGATWSSGRRFWTNSRTFSSATVSTSCGRATRTTTSGRARWPRGGASTGAAAAAAATGRSSSGRRCTSFTATEVRSPPAAAAVLPLGSCVPTSQDASAIAEPASPPVEWLRGRAFSIRRAFCRRCRDISGRHFAIPCVHPRGVPRAWLRSRGGEPHRFRDGGGEERGRGGRGFVRPDKVMTRRRSRIGGGSGQRRTRLPQLLPNDEKQSEEEEDDSSGRIRERHISANNGMISKSRWRCEPRRLLPSAVASSGTGERKHRRRRSASSTPAAPRRPAFSPAPPPARRRPTACPAPGGPPAHPVPPAPPAALRRRPPVGVRRRARRARGCPLLVLVGAPWGVGCKRSPQRMHG